MDYALVRNIVYSSHPRHLSTDIPIDTKIQVVLRIDLDAIGFKKEHVILQDVKMARIVPIDVEYRSRKIIITPLQDLEQNNHYIVEIVGGEKGIRTITNQALEESWMLEFYTGYSNELKAPVIISPTNQTISKEKVTFKWEIQQDAFYYHLQISESNTFNHIIWPSMPDINVYDGEATPDFEYENKRYYARIKAVNFNREESAWSETVQFYIEKEEEESIIDNQFQDPAHMQKPDDETIENKQTEDKPIEDKPVENNPIKDTTDEELGNIQDALENEIEEETALLVKGISINGLVNIPITSLEQIYIEFDEPINPDSINNRTVYLVGERN